jgi:hypothetical protein
MDGGLGRPGCGTEWRYPTRHWQTVIPYTPSQCHADRTTGGSLVYTDACAIPHSPTNGYAHTDDSATRGSTYFNPITRAIPISYTVATSANVNSGIAHRHADATHAYAADRRHTHTFGHPLAG